MKRRLRLFAPPPQRFPVLSAGIAAALTSVVLVVVAAIYLIPFGAIIHGRVPAHIPTTTAGTAHFDKQDTIIITVQRDKTVYVGFVAMRPPQLQQQLVEMRIRYPSRQLELRADRRLTLGDLAPVLSSMRQAGYSQFWVLGNRSSVLELVARVGGT